MLNASEANRTSSRVLFGGQNKAYSPRVLQAQVATHSLVAPYLARLFIAKITDNSCVATKLLPIKPKSLVQPGRQDSLMQYFHLEQPRHEIVLCGRNDCEATADYLEVADDGTEYRLCRFHTWEHQIRILLPASLHIHAKYLQIKV